MNCPKCNCDSLKCTDSRPSNETIRRRRKCLNCGYTFSTFEISMNDYYGLKIKETLLDDVLSYADSVKEKVMKGK